MATEKQIRANQANSKLSTGPSEADRLASRLNATKHGMASRLVEVEVAISPEFADRRAKWAVDHSPVGESGDWALDCAVAATFRIDRCERAFNDLITDVQQRAGLAWEEDRAVEAATTLGRLARDPVLASRQLRTTLAGVVLLIEAWLQLASTLESGGEWSEAEVSKALDLLGIAPDGRSGRTPVDPAGEPTSPAFRLELARGEVARLEALRDEAMIPLDEMDRRLAMAGDVALLSKRAKLLLRYEREAWKRYNQSMKEVKGQAPQPAVFAPTPAIVTPRLAPAKPVAPPKPSFEEERRAIQAAAVPYRKAAIDPLIAMGLTDEDAWIDALEQQLEARYSLPGSYVPIAAGSPGPGAPKRSQFESSLGAPKRPRVPAR